MNEQKRIVIIAGPNGAGKTTFAQEFLPFEAGLPLFINADLIAAGLSPFQPDAVAIRAGRLMLEEIDVAPEVIRRRFDSGMRNFFDVYRNLVDYWQWFNNNGSVQSLIEEGQRDKQV